MNIVFNKKSPLYIQIFEYLKYQIINGNLASGEKLPSRRELAEMLGVNLNTVQKAFKELERENLIITEMGKSSYIQRDISLISKVRGNFINELVNSFILEMEVLNIHYEEIVTILKKVMNQKN
ncbi:GntR family transcriptional regulator [Metalysinibacillus jejuensis]|uniref:GntR family transcriptional regulator n=1 Tax=Metalysinibacillus jejuensis TaxID=914327 RepID=UPI000D392749|nr:GntR family transcriptional regulator [Metalysinibacillus jejuensis]